MKKLLIIGLPLLLVGGGGAVFTLGKLGIVKIPGITPPKKVAKSDKEKKAEPVAKKPKKQPPPKVEASATPAEPQTDPTLGQEKLAELWNEMDVKVLSKVTAKWTDLELAPVLQKMDSGKVVELLTLIANDDTDRAARLTKAIQTEASKI